MPKTSAKIIKAINHRFSLLEEEYSSNSFALENKKNEIIRKVQAVDNITFKNINEICSPYIPEDAETLLNLMHEAGYTTEGITTEDETSIALVYILMQNFELEEEDLNFYFSLPSKTIGNFIKYIGEDNVEIINEYCYISLAARDEAIDELLAQIPFTSTSYLSALLEDNFTL